MIPAQYRAALLASVAALFLATGTAYALNITDYMSNDSYMQCGEYWIYKLPNGEMRSNIAEKKPLPIMVKNGEIFLDDKLCVFRAFSCTTQPLKQC